MDFFSIALSALGFIIGIVYIIANSNRSDPFLYKIMVGTVLGIFGALLGFIISYFIIFFFIGFFIILFFNSAISFKKGKYIKTKIIINGKVKEKQ